MKLNELSGWLRLSLLVSVAYLVIIFINSEDSGEFTSYGVLPVLLCWGAWWVYKGFKKHRKTTAADQNKISNTNSINEVASINSNSSKAAENKLLNESKQSVEQKKFSSKEEYFKWKENKTKELKNNIRNDNCYEDEDPQKYKFIKPQRFQKYGWGWFLLLAGFSTSRKNIFFYNGTLESLDFFLIIPVLIAYFKMRTYFRGKKAYENQWLAGATAFILAPIVYAILSLPLNFYDRNLLSKDAEIFAKETLPQVFNIWKEQENLTNSLISDPKDDSDYKFNAEKADQILKLINDRHALVQQYEYWQKIKVFYMHANKTRTNKEKMGDISKLQNLSNKIYPLELKYWQLHKSYYETKEQDIISEIQIAEKEMDQLNSEYKELSNRIMSQLQ